MTAPEQPLPPSPSAEISGLLRQWREGAPDALDDLMPLVYDELRRRARRQLSRDGSPTLTATALVHEAFLRLLGQGQVPWTDRAHFYAVASLAMRQIVVDHARRRLAHKRGAGAFTVALDEGHISADERADELLALDAALDSLRAVDERLCRVVELHFFGGLSFEETAQVLSLSPRTLKRDWRKARAFLHGALASGPVPREP